MSPISSIADERRYHPADLRRPTSRIRTRTCAVAASKDDPAAITSRCLLLGLRRRLRSRCCFQPLRGRAPTVANHLVYGDRATPYQVLSELAGAMARTLRLDEQLDRMVSLRANGAAADRVEVWFRVASTPQLAVVRPHTADASVPPSPLRPASSSGTFV
jgi:hypothetical protein